MNYRSIFLSHRREDVQRRQATENLKVCPLCGAVNARLNGECFVCRWHGGFSEDPNEIEEGVIEILSRCPELVDSFIELPEPKRSWFERVKTFMTGRRVERHLDMWA